MEDTDKKKQGSDLEHGNEGKPPFFMEWNTLYLFVAGFLAFLILIFYWFTIHFS